MFRNKIFAYFGLFSILFTLVISACGQVDAAPENTPTAAVQATAESVVQVQTEPATNSAASPTQTDTAVSSQDAVQPESTTSRLNINTSSSEEFLTIPGVGNRMVREFMEYRPYISILQFRREIGKYVSSEQVAEYEKYVYIPISINESDADTLQQFTGLDASEAQALIDGRPYATAADFLTKLAGFVSTDALAAAQSYLNQ